MQAIVFDRCGVPTEVLQLREVKKPVPGPGEALVKMLNAPIFLFYAGKLVREGDVYIYSGLLVNGSIIFFTSEMLCTGNFPSLACSRITSSLSAI